MDKTVTPLTTYMNTATVYIFLQKDFEEVVELVPGVNIEYNKAGSNRNKFYVRRDFSDMLRNKNKTKQVRSLVKESNLYKTKKK